MVRRIQASHISGRLIIPSISLIALTCDTIRAVSPRLKGAYRDRPSGRGSRSVVPWSVGRAILLVGLLLVGACSRHPSSEKADLDRPLKIGILPDRSREQLERRYQPLLDHLRVATGYGIETVLVGSYEEQLRSFERKEVDLARLGGLTFVQAESASGAVPLVLRDVDLSFTTDLLVAGSAPPGEIEGFAGGVFSFGPRLSTSGHMMPRYFLMERGIQPETLFREVRYSEGHDQTVAWIQDGEVDVGAVNSLVVEAMLEDGRLRSEDVRLLWRTPPYHNYVWAVQPDLGQGVRWNLREAFLALDVTVPEHRAILELLGARGFLPAAARDFATVRYAAAWLELHTEKKGP